MEIKKKSLGGGKNLHSFLKNTTIYIHTIALSWGQPHLSHSKSRSNEEEKKKYTHSPSI